LLTRKRRKANRRGHRGRRDKLSAQGPIHPPNSLRTLRPLRLDRIPKIPGGDRTHAASWDEVRRFAYFVRRPMTRLSMASSSTLLKGFFRKSAKPWVMASSREAGRA